LSEAWPVWDGSRFEDHTTETVVSALALGRSGYERLELERCAPPFPDLFATSESTGDITIEVTCNADHDETAFRVAMSQFLDKLNKVAASSASECLKAVGDESTTTILTVAQGETF
jgi:hypothetical protein